jgi:site-specific DNA-methyltransferase (adenine-specific)
MILNLDCRHGLAMLPDNSVDAILTDPPYELGFMGHAWDHSGIAYDVAMWREALRVLKPGGHILAFSGSRTYHRMTCAIEDAGAEIRDSIMWVYGSGFPKSLDISKALDKLAGADRQVVSQQYRSATGRDEGYGFGESFDITAPATLAAQIWKGWGTSLKPAHEPICVARKPLGTVAANMLTHGVGGLNIDGCRVGTESTRRTNGATAIWADGGMNAEIGGSDCGRWPANFIHDGSPEVLAMFPQATGAKAPVRSTEASPASDGQVGNFRERVASAEPRGDAGSAARFYQQCAFTQDDLEAALFHYCAKASKREKESGLENFPSVARCNGNRWSDQDYRVLNGERTAGREVKPRKNTHPTVKPIALMRYLCRLVTPPGGLVVDPFAGSGSTGNAAILEGFQFIGFELDPQYVGIANARIEAARAGLVRLPVAVNKHNTGK